MSEQTETKQVAELAEVLRHTYARNYDPSGCAFEILARAAIEHLRPKWQPIESAPKDGTKITLAADNGSVWTSCKWVERTRGHRWESIELGPIPFKLVAWLPHPVFKSTPEAEEETR